jgi:hypothetical protein
LSFASLREFKFVQINEKQVLLFKGESQNAKIDWCHLRTLTRILSTCQIVMSTSHIFYANLSDNYVDLSDLYVDLSDCSVCSTSQKNMLSLGWVQTQTSQQKDLTSQNNYMTSQ